MQSEKQEQKTIQKYDFNELHKIEQSERGSRKTFSNLQKILSNNVKWAKKSVDTNPLFFKELVNIQTPQYLWIGCSDSRVPANQIVGLKPGQVFVHQNVANIVSTSDINLLAVIHFAVEILKVKDIVVCGHYGCGGCKAAFSKFDHGPLQAWLFNIRDIRSKYDNLLKGTQQEKQKMLVELNVKSQVYNVAKFPSIQQAWRSKRELRIHGLVYRLEDGNLQDMKITLSKLSQLKQQFRIVNI